MCLAEYSPLVNVLILLTLSHFYKTHVSRPNYNSDLVLTGIQIQDKEPVSILKMAMSDE